MYASSLSRSCRALAAPPPPAPAPAPAAARFLRPSLSASSASSSPMRARCTETWCPRAASSLLCSTWAVLLSLTSSSSIWNTLALACSSSPKSSPVTRLVSATCLCDCCALRVMSSFAVIALCSVSLPLATCSSKSSFSAIFSCNRFSKTPTRLDSFFSASHLACSCCLVSSMSPPPVPSTCPVSASSLFDSPPRLSAAFCVLSRSVSLSIASMRSLALANVSFDGPSPPNTSFSFSLSRTSFLRLSSSSFRRRW
mmetsp:Transcript_11506/g.25545  ORF Transcript_11506/g.25545 Transcript_11506/m.25545 type:complete len:255 (-) Transcript_11506:741-1505(-)